MKRYNPKLSITAIIYLSTFSSINILPVRASSNFLNKYPQNKVKFANLNPEKYFMKDFYLYEGLNFNYWQFTEKKFKKLDPKILNDTRSELQSKKIKNVLQENYPNFLEVQNRESTSNQKRIKGSNNKLDNTLLSPDKINRDIKDRYYNLVEDKEEIKKTLELLEKESARKKISLPKKEKDLPIGVIAITLGLISIPGLFFIPAILKAMRDTYSNPKVPDEGVELHNKIFKEISKYARQAQRIYSDKFSNKEFLLYFRQKLSLANNNPELLKINKIIKLLEVGIVTQSSFLKIEQTESRYISRKQQEFYSFVNNNISDRIDRKVFRDKVKEKLDRIIPSIVSDEGKMALESYLKEINKISEHDLGLKLLSLFKQYQLDDFTVLRKVDDLVKQLKQQDLFDHKKLTVLVIGNNEVFQKLSPIVGISQDEDSSETYCKLLQYMGLANRHEKSYQQFKKLLEVLKKWEVSYKKLIMIRQQYNPQEYLLPDEFKTDIPGLDLYKIYQEHI